MKRIAILTLLILVATAAFAQQSYGGCQLYPADSIFHMRVDSLPVSTNPAAQLPAADLTVPLHPIFGQTLGDGFEVNVVPATQAMVNITGTSAQAVQYWSSAPIPANAVLEGNGVGCTGTSPSGDCHLIVLQQAATPGGAVISLTSSDATVFPVPSSITIAAGQTAGSATITVL